MMGVCFKQCDIAIYRSPPLGPVNSSPWKYGTYLLGPRQPCPCAAAAALLLLQDWSRTSAECHWWCSVYPWDWATRRAAAHRRAVAEHSAGRSGCHLTLTTGENKERERRPTWRPNGKTRSTKATTLKKNNCCLACSHWNACDRHMDVQRVNQTSKHYNAYMRSPHLGDGDKWFGLVYNAAVTSE